MAKTQTARTRQTRGNFEGVGGYIRFKLAALAAGIIGNDETDHISAQGFPTRADAEFFADKARRYDERTISVVKFDGWFRIVHRVTA